MNWQDTISDLIDKLYGWVEGAVLKLPELALAVLLLTLFWLVANGVRKLVKRLLEQTPAPRQIRGLVSRVAYVAVLVSGLFVALGVLELDKTVTSLLAGAGIIGLALGFAFQDMAANFMAGVYMAFARPIKVGDLIETNDYFGTVERVDLRSLVLRRADGPRVLIPNKDVFGNPLVNYNVADVRRVDLSVGVAYGDDLELARKVALETAEALEGRHGERPAEVYFTEFGGSSINFVVRFWIPFAKQSDYMKAQSAAIMALKSALDEAGLTIPFPITTLDFGVVGGEKLSETLPRRWYEGAGGDAA